MSATFGAAPSWRSASLSIQPGRSKTRTRCSSLVMRERAPSLKADSAGHPKSFAHPANPCNERPCPAACRRGKTRLLNHMQPIRSALAADPPAIAGACRLARRKPASGVRMVSHGREVDCVGMTAASVCLWRHPAPRRAIRIRRPFRDEPFGALDAKLREDLHKWLREIHDRTGLTTLIVTHDQDEAMDISHRVAILNQGRIEQIGRPGDVSTAPISIFVREFLQ